MKKSKQKRLAAAGWRVGTPAEFLKLDEIESQVVEIKLSLSEALRTAREQRQWTQTQLAEKIGSSQSRVARMEGGDQGVSLDLLVQGLLAAGATRRSIAKAVAHRKKAVSA
jgi:ribosome-binding protein aMBF1 (putative translation factor)